MGQASTDFGACLPNVRAFVDAHRQEAEALAAALGHDVTPAEVLATAGNETHYGDTSYNMVKNGNFFGLHGAGPAGTYYTARNHTPTAKFPVDQGFPMSGAAFVKNVGGAMTPGIGLRPFEFFSVLNKHGYATGNPGYATFMTRAARGNRGPYQLIQACMAQK